MSEKYYLTTAINYTNGSPHIGHCFEAILADFMARTQRFFGKKVFFLTGTDEHGLKIAKTAEAQGISPIELCDRYAKQFQDLANRLQISHNFFIRTTMPEHTATVLALFSQIQEKGDIYLGEYQGWYNVREETYVSESDAEKCNFLDSVTNTPLSKVTEASYFFNLSKYHAQIKKHIEDNPDFIYPESRRQEILARLEEPLRDLSISRTSFDWGIPVPNDPKHCLYVWMDALINYYTGIVPQPEFWPPNLHVIGKDILWFHAVIWPGILLSAELELPKQILVHNFISAEDGRKMSKSLGNTIDLDQILADFSVPVIRWYLLSEANHERDLHFSVKKLILINNEHADKIGNLTSRLTSLTEKYCQGKCPNEPAIPLFSIDEFREQLITTANNYQFHQYLTLLQEKIALVNLYLVEQSPWFILTPKDSTPARSEHDRQQIIRTALEMLFIIACAMEPIQPSISLDILNRLGHKQPKLLAELTWNNLNQEPITKGPYLFTKIEVPPMENIEENQKPKQPKSKRHPKKEKVEEESSS